MAAPRATERRSRRRPGAAAPAAHRTGWTSAALAAALVALVVAAYGNGLGGPFIWDDLPAVPDNPRIRALGWAALGGTSRPLVQLSFALNHALGGLAVGGYHVFNVAVHALAALALFALAARTLALPRLAPRFGRRAPWLAAGIAALWAAHPLQTEAVTYVVQRAESMASLFYLLLLYALARGADSARPWRWHAAAVACMALGTASKPVMATAPLVALLYDRCFLAGSFRAAVARRRGLYLALVAALAVLPLALALGPRDWRVSTGFALRGLTPGGYALTQLAVVPHYLWQALWPAPLVLDYAWPTARGLADVAPGALVLLPLLVLTLIGVARNHPLGFLGAWLFVILAPTSSVFPIADAAFEHRMYLPLAAPAALAVAGLAAALDRVPAGARPAARALAVALVLVAVAALFHGTRRRNEDYAGALAIWSDTVAKNPINPRARVQLGQALAAEGRADEAIAQFETAVRLNPGYGRAVGSLTHALDAAGRLAPGEAARGYARALELDPDQDWTRADLGLARLREGRPAEAESVFAALLGARPDFAYAHYGMGVALAVEGRRREGRSHIARALELDPGNEAALRALAWVDSLLTAAGGAPR